MAQTDDAPAIALVTPTSAVGVIRSTQNGGELYYTTWASPGSFEPFTAMGSGITTAGAPAMAATSGLAYLVFWGDNSKHYYSVWDSSSSSWSPLAAQVAPPGGLQSFGPSPASITALGDDVVIAYAGNDHNVYDQTFTSGAWQTSNGHGVAAQDVTLTPAIIAPTSGADLMIVYVRGDNHQIWFTTQTAGTWSSPAAVSASYAFSNLAVSLAPLPDGGAMLAYQGQDGKVYWSQYTPQGSPPWSQPTAVATPSWSTPSVPMVAPGLDGMTAEMVFADSASTSAEHSRFSTTWSSPSAVGGSGLTCVGISSM